MRARSLARLTAAVALTATAALAPSPALAASGPARALRAGAGQADITPPKTGYYLGGWTRADRLALGQSSRLFANAIVLQRGTRKVALVAAELFAIPGGLQEDVARRVADLGYDVPGVLLAASHTHSAPGGFANNPTYNTAAPSTATVGDPGSFARFFDPAPADRQLYTFLVDQIALAIRRADRDRARAVAGWGRSRLSGLTENRSIEAHLRNHGIDVPQGQGKATQDPGGYEHTIDPAVDVLRVDKIKRGKRVPIGAWSDFADHGTVVKSDLQAYSGDHHAAAWRLFAKLVRRAGRVPASQAVVDVYPNSDEGDQTAGLKHGGPAGAQEVGEQEATAMVRAWRDAGTRLSATPALDLRWTRACFCGRDTASGPVDATGRPGLAFLTGSEEGRGPLYDATGQPFEGRTNPITDPVQGDKIIVPAGNFPPAVPLAVLRVADGVLVSVPGEATKEVGTRMKDAVLGELAPAGVTRAVIAGLAYDFIQYITTPEEYGQQSYEGASTLYGQNEAPFLQERAAELARALRDGAPAPEPYAFDASYGVKPDGPAFDRGAASGRATAQPAAKVERLQRAAFAWDGGPSGTDRPVDAAFITAERRTRRGRWVGVEDDLGLSFLWRSDGEGHYRAQWEVPLSTPAGTYRLHVTASRYELTSDPFEVVPTDELRVEAVDGPGSRPAVRLRYPVAKENVDLTARPSASRGGTVTFSRADGGDAGTVTSRNASTFAAPPGSGAVRVAAGAARDRYGNAAQNAVALP